MARLTIDGQSIECAEGTTVLAAARSLGIDIPTLCDDDRLEPTGACRLCLVEVAGSPRPVAACTALVHEGMSIDTASPALTALRRMMLEWLATFHTADACLNRVTSRECDPVGTPEYKVTAVRLERIVG